MLRSRAMCEQVLSMDSPSSSQLTAGKSAWRLAKAMNSVVHGREVRRVRKQHQLYAAVVLELLDAVGGRRLEGRGGFVETGHGGGVDDFHNDFLFSKVAPFRCRRFSSGIEE